MLLRAEMLLVLAALVALVWCITAWVLLPHPLSWGVVAFAALSVCVPALAVGAWQGVLSRQKIRLAQALANRLPAHLLETLEPLETAEIAADLLPMAQSLNQVIARLKDIYQNERDFSAHASHELRTPLSGIKLQAELALRTGDDKARTKALRHVLRGVDRCTQLVEQMLTLSRLAPSKIEGHIQSTNLVRVAQMVLATIAPRAQEKSISLQLAAGSHGRALVHKDSIAILLSNLLRNAVIYTPAGGAVEVSIAPVDAHSVCLCVSDNGPGIQVQDRGRVQARLSKSAHTDQSGTGLGLAIVKRIADLHGGRVELSSPDSGTGLVVRVYLPAAAEHHTPETEDSWELPAHAMAELV